MGGGDCVLKPKLQGRELGGAALSRNQGGTRGVPGLGSQEALMLRMATLHPKALGKKNLLFPNFSGPKRLNLKKGPGSRTFSAERTTHRPRSR